MAAMLLFPGKSIAAMAAPTTSCSLPRSPGAPPALIATENLSFGYGRASLHDRFDLRPTEPGVYRVSGRNGSGTAAATLAGRHAFTPRRRQTDAAAA